MGILVELLLELLIQLFGELFIETSLLAIHDDLTDGAEILWNEHDNRTIGKIRSWIKRKEELEVFDDTPASGDPT